MKDNCEDLFLTFSFSCYYTIRGDFVNIKYEDLFKEEDGLLSISRDDFRCVTSGKDIFYKILHHQHLWLYSSNQNILLKSQDLCLAVCL